MAWNFELLCEQEPKIKMAMEALGNATPTANAQHKMVKGCVIDFEDGGTHKLYWTSDDLRDIAFGLNSMANWLDTRSLSEAEAPVGEGA